MKSRTIGKEPVSIGKRDRFHPLVNQHFVTSLYENGRFDRGFLNPSYKMFGKRVVPQVFVTILLQNVGSRSLRGIAIEVGRENSIKKAISKGMRPREREKRR